MSGGQTHSVKRHLDVDAHGYDVQIRRFIPYYDDMLATGVELLRALAPPAGHVVDLGGGTGALSAVVLDGLPRVRVTVLDVDPDMLSEARRRLSGYGERVAFREGSFLDPLPSADAVVASLALHHVHDLQAKTELYRAIYDALSPGGVLVNLDAAVSEGARLNALVFDRWAQRMSEHGMTESQAAITSPRGQTRIATFRLRWSWARCARRALMRSSASGDAERPRSPAPSARGDHSTKALTPERTPRQRKNVACARQAAAALPC